MLDLDKYIENCVEIKIFGEVLHVKEPSMRMVEEVEKIEKDMEQDNINQKRLQTAQLFLNNNTEDRIITIDELKKVPFEGIIQIITEVSLIRLKADQDPN